jgi:hypothetical protein
VIFFIFGIIALYLERSKNKKKLVEDPRIQNQESRIKNQESRIKNQESRIKIQNSKTPSNTFQTKERLCLLSTEEWGMGNEWDIQRLFTLQWIELELMMHAD